MGHKTEWINTHSKLDFLKHVSLRPPQQFAEILVHASHSQLLQAVVTMVDSVLGHYDHPGSVGVFSQLAADGWAHDHVQAFVATAGVSMVVAREDCCHPCGSKKKRGHPDVASLGHRWTQPCFYTLPLWWLQQSTHGCIKVEADPLSSTCPPPIGLLSLPAATVDLIFLLSGITLCLSTEQIMPSSPLGCFF